MVEQRYVMIDLDGTLSDCRHRSTFAQQGLWEEFNSLLHLDPVYPDVRCLLEHFHIVNELKVIVCTGRSEKWKAATIEWMLKNDLINMIDVLLMRSEIDYSSDVDVKIKLLENHFGSKEGVINSISFALEDRDKVVDGLRDYGIATMQVRPGGY